MLESVLGDQRFGHFVEHFSPDFANGVDPKVAGSIERLVGLGRQSVVERVLRGGLSL